MMHVRSGYVVRTMTHLQEHPSETLPEHRTLTVASVPSGHVHVRHLSPLVGEGPYRLPDPDPDGPVRTSGATWSPPTMLTTDWASTAQFDVFHLHFGFDACPPDQLQALVDVLRRRGKPFVFTVHDLRNPHHLDRTLHDAQLDVLVPAADCLVTLTHGAAAEIERRWGRRAHVVPHPHVVDLATMEAVQRARAARGRRETFRVGMHLKSLRADMAPLRLLPTLVEAVGGLDDAVLQVNGHRDLLEPGGDRFDPALHRWLRQAEEQGQLELHVHEPFDDDSLWAHMASLELSVLPYRFGTHSAWLEACRDLGTTVLAPTCGHYADQGPVLTYDHDEEGVDTTSLHSAVLQAYEERPHFGASPQERQVQRTVVARTHEEIYRGLLV